MALSRLRSFWRNLRHGDRVERELDDEMRATLDLLIDEKIAEGVEPGEARRRAMIELGGVEPIKERVRDARSGVTLDALWQDLKFAVRQSRRSPAFTTAAVLTLALGIGANTAMFTMLNAILFKRLAIEKPDELVAIAPLNARGLPRSTPMSAIEELKDGPLDRLCPYMGGVVLPVLANDIPVQTSTTFVTSDCLASFGISPVLGRGLTAEETPIDGAGARVAMISHRLWTSVFNGDQTALGKTMLVNNVPVTIVGVLPQGFAGLEIDHGVDIYTPYDTVLAAGKTRRQLASFLLGRLRPGQTLESASAEIEAKWPAILEAVLPANLPPTERTQLLDSKPRLVTMGTGTSRVRERYVEPLGLVFGLTALLLILACVNLGGLLLARLNARSSELTVRLALGGTRWRIARQMLVESLLLSLAGGALAVPFAYWTAVGLASFMPPLNVPYTISFVPDLRVFAAATAVAVIVGVLMSALPVIIAARRTSTIRWDRTIVGHTGWWGRGLLVAQISMAIVMLINAALLARSLYMLQHGDLGIRTENLLTVKMWPLPASPYTRADREAYYPVLADKMRGVPGVTSIALASQSPRQATTNSGSPIALRGEPYVDTLTGALDSVSPRFFDTLGIRLLAGRDVSWMDTLKTQPVAVVSESLARALASDGNVLGRAISMRTLPNDLEFTIVGIASDATMGDPRHTRPRVIYRPLLQVTAISALNPNLIIQTTDPASAASSARLLLKEFNRDYAQEVISVDDLLARAPATERMSATVAAVVGGLAVLLALIGVHAALAYSVARRTREIGVRLALGAAPGRTARLIIGEAVLVCLLGVAVGLPLAALGARSLRSLMFGISETDPVTFAAAAIAFVLMGLVAAAAPAWRAASVDPVTALRSE